MLCGCDSHLLHSTIFCIYSAMPMRDRGFQVLMKTSGFFHRSCARVWVTCYVKRPQQSMNSSESCLGRCGRPKSHSPQTYHIGWPGRRKALTSKELCSFAFIFSLLLLAQLQEGAYKSRCCLHRRGDFFNGSGVCRQTIPRK